MHWFVSTKHFSVWSGKAGIHLAQDEKMFKESTLTFTYLFPGEKDVQHVLGDGRPANIGIFHALLI